MKRTLAPSDSESSNEEEESYGETEDAVPMAMDEGPDPAVGTEPPNKMSKRDLYKPPTTSEISQLKETENLFHSTLFRMQITELLAEVKLSDKRCRLFDKAIEIVKNMVMNVKEGKKHELQDTKWLKKSGIKVPLPQGIPETKGNFKFIPPRDVKLTGSYLCGTCVRPQIHTDLLLVMPNECFDHKDFLNHRYLRKRALYLCKVAMALSGQSDVQDVKFTYHHGNHLKPIIVVTVTVPGSQHAVQLHLHAIPEENYFKMNRFSVAKSNVRSQWFHNSSDRGQEEEVPTPFYNSSILEDVSAVAMQEYLQQQLLSSSQGVKEGIVLLKIWLRQRTLDKGCGAFSGHIMSLYVLYLLSQRKLNPQLSSYQVMRNTLLRLAQSDWTTDGITLCTDSTDVNMPTISEFHRHFDVVFVDPTGYMNICYDMERTTFQRVKHEASIAMTMLDNKFVDSFTALFITKLPFNVKFDHLVHICPLTAMNSNLDKLKVAERHLDSAGDCRYTCLPSVLRLIERGLGQRTTLIQAQLRPTPTWAVTVCPEEQFLEDNLTIGLLLDSEFAFNALDRGPSADTEEAKEFRAFWGEKSDLRRFQDGGICEAVLWLDNATANQKQLVCGHVIKFVLNRHAGIPHSNIHYVGGQVDSILHLPIRPGPAPNLPYGTGEEQTIAMMYVYEDLCKQLRSLTDLPLTITSIHGVDPSFRYTEVFPPMPCTFHHKDKYAKLKNTRTYIPSTETFCPVYVPSLKVVCLLESSSKWPEDVEAMRRLKAAFHLQLAECLRSSHSLPIKVTTTHIDVLKDHYVFRVVLAYTKEISLLKTVRTPDGMVRKRDTDEAVALIKEIVSLPRLTSTLHGLQQQHNSFSTAVRLAKRWVCAQLLGDHIDPVAVELIVASLYLAPAPYTVPRSGLAGFQRFLKLLSTFDWNMTPLMINLNNEFTETDYAEIPMRFAKERSTLPLMFLSTPLDKYSSHWTKHSPTPPILHRLVLLAQKSSAIIDEQLHKDKPCLKQVFRPSTEVYDALIHLNKMQLPRQHECVDVGQGIYIPRYIQTKETGVFPVTDFDPVQLYLQELRETFADLCLFFHDTHGGNVIGILWKPQALMQKEFKVSHINYSQLKSDSSKDGGAMMLEANMEAIIEDMKVIGKGLVDSIQLKNT